MKAVEHQEEISDALGRWIDVLQIVGARDGGLEATKISVPEDRTEWWLQTNYSVRGDAPYSNIVGAYSDNSMPRPIVEVNPPLRGIPTVEAGLIARQSTGELWLLHSGSLPGNKSLHSLNLLKRMTASVLFSNGDRKIYFKVAPLSAEPDEILRRTRIFLGNCSAAPQVDSSLFRSWRVPPETGIYLFSLEHLHKNAVAQWLEDKKIRVFNRASDDQSLDSQSSNAAGLSVDAVNCFSTDVKIGDVLLLLRGGQIHGCRIASGVTINQEDDRSEPEFSRKIAALNAGASYLPALLPSLLSDAVAERAPVLNLEKFRSEVAQLVGEGWVEIPNGLSERQKEKPEPKYALTLVRPGQATFRNNLLEQYGENCCVFGPLPPTVLQAAHISPYSNREDGIDDLENGLLLRADVHLLFDAFLLTIDPAMMTMHLAPSLLPTGVYAALQGRRVNARHASKERLTWHHETARGCWTRDPR